MRSMPVLLTVSVILGAPAVLRAAGELTAVDRASFAERFAREVWPLMSQPDDPEKSCLACHRDDCTNTSAFVLSGPPEKVFGALLDDGYFDLGSASSVLSRVAHRSPRSRMPPEPLTPWSAKEVDVLRTFVRVLNGGKGAGSGGRGTDRLLSPIMSP